MSFAREILRGSGIGAGLVGPMGGAAAAGAISKSWGTVPEGYRGIRTQLKKVPKFEEDRPKKPPLKPGFHPTMPFTHSIVLINVENRANTGKATVERKEGLYDVEAAFIWQVLPDGDNPYRALYHVNDGEDLTQIVTGICRAGLSKAITTMDKDHIQRPKAVLNEVNNHCLDRLLYFGVALNAVEIQEVFPNTDALTASAIREGIQHIGGLAIANGISNTELKVV